jgi:hypothetical protein
MYKFDKIRALYVIFARRKSMYCRLVEDHKSQKRFGPQIAKPQGVAYAFAAGPQIQQII